MSCSPVVVQCCQERGRQRRKDNCRDHASGLKGYARNRYLWQIMRKPRNVLSPSFVVHFDYPWYIDAPMSTMSSGSIRGYRSRQRSTPPRQQPEIAIIACSGMTEDCAASQHWARTLLPSPSLRWSRITCCKYLGCSCLFSLETGNATMSGSVMREALRLSGRMHPASGNANLPCSKWGAKM